MSILKPMLAILLIAMVAGCMNRHCTIVRESDYPGDNQGAVRYYWPDGSECGFYAPEQVPSSDYPAFHAVLSDPLRYGSFVDEASARRFVEERCKP